MISQMVGFYVDLVVVLVHLFCDGGVLSFNLEPTLPVIKRGEASSYFGFSVAQHSTSNGSPWILVGAPLGQNLQPRTNRSGALFKCPISGQEQDCVQVVTDGKRDPNQGYDDQSVNSEQLSGPVADELKDGQWLGVNVRSQGAGQKVVVCAHRYIHQGKDFRWGVGLCHFLKSDFEYDTTLQPCRNKQFRGFEDYGYCQAGTSAAILEDSTALLGAPGSFTARGMLFGISVSDDYINKDRNQYTTPLLERSPVHKYEYLGMSVTGGKFFGDKISYVAGAPKAANFSGQVIFFSKDPVGNIETLQVTAILTGETFASSYGYELATLDLNGDKLPDLVVGAPFYEDRKRKLGGAAYVYLNTDNGIREDTPYVRLTGPDESRFGLAISTIGDLNKDTFDDLAIGAPYAEEGKGCVYIYLGSKDGVIREPSQIIQASQHFSWMRTFGYSLSGGMDLDGNSYPDLVVGAYESDTVVLLRSRPIIDILTNVHGNLTDIDPNGHGCEEDPDSEEVCFSFEACFDIRDVAQVPSVSFEVESQIEAETYVESKKFSRVKFRNGQPDRPQVIKRTVTVKQNRAAKHCSSELVYLKKPTTDIQTAIAFKLTYKLIQNLPIYIPNASQLPKIQDYPILNQQEASRIFVARFEKACKSDLCESDLFVSALTNLEHDENNYYKIVLGKDQELVLNVNVQNYGEPAYEANLYISHPKSMSYIATESSQEFISCSPAPTSDLVICHLGNPYKNRSLLTLKVRFSSSNLKDIETRLDFDIWANSTSMEQDEQNNRFHVTATVIKMAELVIYGKSEPGNVYYGGKIMGESAIHSFAEIGPPVVHAYSIYNEGPWKASSFNVTILWPHQVENKKQQGKWLLYPESVPSVDGDVTCFLPEKMTDVLHLRPKRSVEPDDDGDELVVAPQEGKGADGKIKKYVGMDCVRPSAKCFEIECVIKNLLAKETAVIKIHSRLWNTTLVEDYSQVDEVRIWSKAQIRISDDIDIRQNKANDVASALTTCYPDLKLKVDFDGIAWWIYALSIIVGILVLALIVFCLYRTGFFKRRRPEPTHTASIVKS